MNKWNDMRDMADRIARRAEIYESRFSEYGAAWRPDLVLVITEGNLGGRRFAAYLPVTEAHASDESERESLINHCRDVWRFHAASHLFRPEMVIGPKGKLPA